MSIVEDIKEKVDDHLERGKRRLETCKSCTQYVHSHDVCGSCICYMPVKVNFPYAECPYSYWEE